MVILRAAIDAFVEESRPCQLECLEPRGERVDLTGDVLIERLACCDARGEEGQGLAVTDDVVTMAEAIWEDQLLADSWRDSVASTWRRP